MPIADPTHAIYASKAEAEAYLAKRNIAADLPRLVGQPGGDDPTGRRHLYPAQTLETSLETVQEAADKSAYAATLDEKIDPGAKAVKGKLDGEKWKAKAVDEKPVEEVKTK
jgi:hypothetical protein